MVAEEVSNLPTMGLRTSVFQMARAINTFADSDSSVDENVRMTA